MKFKKIISVLASAVMLSSTIGFAAAANYPEPFVSGGTAGGAVVYGANAATTDVIAAIDMQANLQGLVTSGSGTTSSSTSGESVLFETGTNKLNIGNNLTEIKTVSITDTDLPTVLADGTYSNADSEDFDYEQKIDVSDDLEFAHWADSNYNSKKPTLGVKIEKNDLILNYTLDFVKSAEDDTASGDDLDDFEDTTIGILGKNYDIVTAVNTSGTTKLTLMGGAEKDTLSLNDVKDYTVDGKSYNVGLTYVDSNGYCRFNVDGTLTNKILKGGTAKLSDGTYIGVADYDYSTGAVTEIMNCKFYLGADKIVLEDGKEVEINDEDVDDLRVYWDETDGSPFKINKMTLEWKAHADTFITEDSEAVMPGFSSVKLTAGGLIAPTGELIKVRGSSNDDVDLTVTLKSGETTIQLLGSNGTGGFDTIGGFDDNQGLATVAGHTAATQITYNASGGANGDQYFVATYLNGADGSSYLVEVSDTDETDGVDFKDVISGTKLAENIKNTTSFTLGDATFYLEGFIEDEWVKINATGTNTYMDRLVTDKGLVIYLPINNAASTTSPNINLSATNLTTNPYPSSYIIWMEEEDKDGNLAATTGDDINVTVSHTTSNNVQAQISVTADNIFSGGTDFEDPDDDNLYIGYTESDLGTKVVYDADPDEDTVDITYFGEQVYGSVFIAESGAVVTPGSTSTSAGGQILVVKDNQISSVSDKNLIVVGGSCINTVAAKILGSDVPLCESAFTGATSVGAGQYIIKTVASPYNADKVAMLVAGYNAADTTNAVAKALEGVSSDVDSSQVYPIVSA